MIGVISARGLRRSWFLSVTAGECAGFAAPALTAALLSGTPDRVFVPAMLLAGGIEGAVLGFAQARVLRRALDDLPVGAWSGATAAAAAVAYAIGFAPSQLGNRLTGLPLAVLIPVAAVGALVLLATIGVAQWPLLRHRVHRAWRWIPITAAAWAAGLGAFTAVAPPLWQPDQPVALVAAIGLLGGLVMAATVAAITGAALPHLLSSPALTHSTPQAGA